MNKGNALVAFLLCLFSMLHADTRTHLESTPLNHIDKRTTNTSLDYKENIISVKTIDSQEQEGLSLSATGTPAEIGAWSFATTTFTLTNHSSTDFTNVTVALNIDAGVVLEGGNEYNASQGFLSQSWTATPTWQVGTLAAGATITLNLNLFTLADGILPIYGQVNTANGFDPNSTPGNGSCCVANEDDEAVFTFNGIDGPDLSINIISASSSIVQVGDDFSINVDVRKTGADVNEKFFVGMFLSTDNTLSFNDDIQIGLYEFPNGISSGLVNVDVEAFNTNVAPGTYSVFMMVDHTGLISETNENNNYNYTTIEFVGSSGQPDIINVDFSAPNQLEQGQNATATFKVVNNGDGIAIGSFQTKMYFSDDAFVSSDDILLSTTTRTNLPPGFNVSTVNASFLTPSNRPPGQYWLVLSADDGDTIDESIENNNVNAINITLNENTSTLEIDLALSFGARTPANPSQWGFYSETLTLTNTGTIEATDVTVQFQKPAGVSYEGGNEYVASQGSFQTWAAQIWSVGTIPIGGSATLQVNYFLLAPSVPTAYAQVMSANEGDSDSTPGNGTCCTPNEDDEASTNSTPPTDQADLTLANLTITNMAGAGEVLDYQFDLSNIGTALAAGDFSIKAYISTDANLSADDIQDGIVPTGNIGAGVTIAGVPGQSTLPSNLAEGDYFLILKVDADDDIVESNENNNLISTTFTISSTSEPSCAFISRINTPDIPLPSINYSDNGFTESNGEYFIEFGPYSENSQSSLLSNQYHLDANGNLVEAEAVEYPTSDDEVIVEVDEDDNVEIVFVHSVDPPSGTRVTIPLDNLPSDIGAIIFNNPVEISNGYAFGLTVVNGDNGTTSNRVIQTDDQGNLTRTDEIPGLNDTFYSGFNRLTEGSDGGIYTWWLTSGNYSLFGVPADNSPAWVFRVAADTPSSTWVDTKVSTDGQFVYTAKVDNLESFVSKLDATTGELLGYPLQDFINTNNIDGFRYSFMHGIEPTSDGGLLLSIRYTELGNGPTVRGQLIGKLDANGQTVWVQQISPSNLLIEPLGETSDGGGLFGGVDRGDVNTTDDDQPIFIKTTADGTLDPLCGGTPPSEGVDVELSFDLIGEPNPAQWSIFSATLTATNTGTETATAVSVDYPKPDGLVYEGGNEYILTQGTFDVNNGSWQVGSLAPGATAILEINYFRLSPNPISIYAQVDGLAEPDVDSTPDNGVCCTANEDDEAALQIGAPSQSAQDRSRIEAHLDEGAFAIIHAMPNPIMDRFRLKVFANEAQVTELAISNALGQIIYTQAVSLEKGINIVPIDVSEQAAGLMTITMSPFHPYLRQIRVLKVRN